MIVLDASVLIALLDADDSHHLRAVELLRDHATMPFVASVMTLAETLVGPSRAGVVDKAQAAITGLGVESIPLLSDDAASLAVLRATSGMRMPDCCVLLACERTGGAIATFDDRLAAAAKAIGTDIVG